MEQHVISRRVGEPHISRNSDTRFRTRLRRNRGILKIEPAVAGIPVGKREAIGHPLPVVAIGLIPYIYRRASFSHRAAPKEIAPYGEQHYRSLTARQRSLQLSNPRREICFFFKRQLSFLEIRLYFMHLIRLRIHASNFVNWVVTVANTGLK